MKCSCVYGRQQHQDFLSVGHAADKDSQHADPNTAQFVTVTPRKYLDCKSTHVLIVMYSYISILSIPATYKISVAVRSTACVRGPSSAEIPIEGADVLSAVSVVCCQAQFSATS